MAQANRIAGVVLAVAAAGALAAAGPARPRVPEPAGRASGQGPSGRIAVFVVGSAKAEPWSPLEVLEVRAVPRDAEPLVLVLDTARLEPALLRGHQEPLAQRVAPAGPYRGLRLLVREAEKGNEKKREPQEVALTADFRVWDGEVTSLVVEWDLAQDPADPAVTLGETLHLRRAPETVRDLTLYVVDRAGNRLLALDRRRDRVFAVVPVGASPSAVAVSPDGRRAYVANAGDDSVTVVDPATQRVLDVWQLRAGSAPADLVVGPAGRRLVVSCPGRQALAILDRVSSALVGEVLLARSPGRLAAGRDSALVYALLPAANQIVAVDLDRLQVLGTAAVEGAPADLAVDPRTGDVVVTQGQAPVLTVLASNLQPGKKFQSGFPTYGIAVEPDGSRYYLTGGDTGIVAFLSPGVGAVTRQIPTPPAYLLALDPDGRKAYAAGGTRGTVLVLDRVAGRLVDELRLNGDLVDLAVVP